jgi:hypothetical protein
MLKIFYRDSKWKGFETPAKPEFKGDYFLHYGPQKKYEADYAEARANALEVLNPEILKQVGYLDLDHKDGEFDWSGTWSYSRPKLADHFIILSLPSKETKEETQDELWEEFVHEDMTIEELKAKYIITRR